MKSLILLLPLALAAGGCAAFTDDSVGLDNGVQVATAFYPLQYVAERVAGDLGRGVDVENLTAPGGEPHDLELTVRETADIARADLVVYERGFQPAVDSAVDENAQGDVLDVSDVADLVPFRDHGVDSAEDDPHFWQDPLRLADVGGRGRGPARADRPRPRRRLRGQRGRPARGPGAARPAVRARPGRLPPATRSSSATTRSATSSATGCTWRPSSASPPTPSPRRPTCPGSRT